MDINLQNIEEIIFYNKDVWKNIPELKQFYDQWVLSKTVSGLNHLSKKSILDFMNSLNSSHIEKLQKFFSTTIIIDKIQTNVVSFLECDKNDVESKICCYDNYKDFFIIRNKDKVDICFWR